MGTIIIGIFLASSNVRGGMEAELFNYPIHNLQSDSVEAVINSSIESLDNNNWFVIPNLLSTKAIKLFYDELTSDDMDAFYDAHPVYKTVFLRNNDNQYPSYHVRNHLQRSDIHWVFRSMLESFSSKLIDFYNYDPMLSFLKQIVTNSRVAPYTNLIRSIDPNGSIFALILKDHGEGIWHFDTHPFSCAWVIQKSINDSGATAFADIGEISKTWTGDMYGAQLSVSQYNLIHNILIKNETEDISWRKHIQYYYPNEGDMFCFNGNLTMHRIMNVYGSVDRITIVAAFREFKSSFNSVFF